MEHEFCQHVRKLTTGHKKFHELRESLSNHNISYVAIHPLSSHLSLQFTQCLSSSAVRSLEHVRFLLRVVCCRRLCRQAAVARDERWMQRSRKRGATRLQRTRSPGRRLHLSPESAPTLGCCLALCLGPHHRCAHICDGVADDLFAGGMKVVPNMCAHVWHC